MDVDPQSAAYSFTYQGRNYFFCHQGCLDKFRADPGKFLATPASLTRIQALPSADRAPTEYTCPMHPEVIRNAPGFCPICGMALEPRVAPGAEANSELGAMTRRFWISAILSLPLLIIGMSELGAEASLRRLVPANA